MTDLQKRQMQKRYVEVMRRLVAKHTVSVMSDLLGITHSTLLHRMNKPSAIRLEHALALKQLRREL